MFKAIDCKQIYFTQQQIPFKANILKVIGVFCMQRECTHTQSTKRMNPLCKSKVVKVIYYNYFHCQLFYNSTNSATYSA